MTETRQPVIFGEVLFDCFPDGSEVLGGAPFNVAWHLQAFGDKPFFISSVGRDPMGEKILQAMQAWNMETTYVQQDPVHPTGHVDITLINNEPHYDITPDCAYDYINAAEISIHPSPKILYHGSLAMRNDITRHAYESLVKLDDTSIFLDVNLRPPWWNKKGIALLLKNAHWVKLNQDELSQLSACTNIEAQMSELQDTYSVDLLIVTRGEEGAIVRERNGTQYSVKPPSTSRFIDTVGAGDAFTAVFLHGLLMGKAIADVLEAAQEFASRVVGLRGATTRERGFYQAFIDDVLLAK